MRRTHRRAHVWVWAVIGPAMAALVVVAVREGARVRAALETPAGQVSTNAAPPLPSNSAGAASSAGAAKAADSASSAKSGASAREPEGGAR